MSIGLNEGKSHGCGTVKRRSNLRDSVLIRARSVGIAGDVESMQLALVVMVAGYDRLLATTPEQFHGHIAEAFGKGIDVARAILEAV